jgi:hypothetical protein
LDYGLASTHGGELGARISLSESVSALARSSDMAGAGMDGVSIGTTAVCCMAGVPMDSTVARSMTATPTSAVITGDTRLTAMATAQLAVSLLPAAQVHTEAEKADIVVRQAEDRRERGQALSAATAAGEKRVDTLPADDRVMAVVLRTVADTPVAEGTSPRAN